VTGEEQASREPEASTSGTSASGILEFNEFVWELLQEKRAVDPVWLDVREVTDLADDFMIATFTNPRQGAAIVEACEKERKARKLSRVGVEGLNGGTSSWIVLDYGDLVVHLLMPDQREYYALEHLWADAKRIR